MRHYHALFFIFFMLVIFPIKISAEEFKQIIFFGDSLTDNGNLYQHDFGVLPKSPPYFQGQFSNGRVWSEVVAKYFHDKHNIPSENYAIGGEAVVFHNPFGGYLPYVLSESISNYLLRTLFTDKSQTLFIIWIGANDYLPGATEVESATTNVVASIKYAINRIISAGGKNFLILNLPDLSRIPYGKASAIADNLHRLTLQHNTKLATAISQLQVEHRLLKVYLFDLNQLFNNLIDHPDEMNKKYNTHIIDTTTACWQGGYTLQQLEAQLEKEINARATTKMDVQRLAQTILNSPDLATAYQVGENYSQGVLPCKNADEFLFWDFVHPTTVTHQILAEVLIDYINQHLIAP